MYRAVSYPILYFLCVKSLSLLYPCCVPTVSITYVAIIAQTHNLSFFLCCKFCRQVRLRFQLAKGSSSQRLVKDMDESSFMIGFVLFVFCSLCRSRLGLRCSLYISSTGWPLLIKFSHCLEFFFFWLLQEWMFGIHRISFSLLLVIYIN